MLLDLTMPGICGPELFVEVRRLAPRLPIILCSGYSAPSALHSLADEANAVFMAKPYRYETLITCVLKVITPGTS